MMCLLVVERSLGIIIKYLFWPTILNIVVMLLLIVSRYRLSNNKFDWVIALAIILIIVNIVMFFVEYKKLK